MNKIKEHKTIYLIIYVLYAFLIALTSFGNGIMNYFVMTILYLFIGVVENISVLSIVIEYFLIGIIYFSFGVVSLNLFLNCYNELKYVIIYSVIVNIAVIIVSMIIKSFYELDIIKYIFKIVFNMLGILIAFIIEFLKVKVRN